MSSAQREKELLVRSGVEPPLPARYEKVEGGFRLCVRTANPLTKDWRSNVNAAEAGSVPPLVQERPSPPIVYGLPKVVLERQPDESLDSASYASEYAYVMSTPPRRKMSNHH